MQKCMGFKAKVLVYIIVDQYIEYITLNYSK